MTRTTRQNPYTLVFGREPDQLIQRKNSAEMIIDTFTADIPSQQVYMITGIRGSGKTVFMSSIAEYFQKQDDFVIAELSTEADMLRGLAAKLSSQDKLARLFQTSKINLSLFGFGLEVSGAAPIADMETALEKMLDSLKGHGKKLLICIDEVMPSDYLRTFCSSFQIFVREKLPVFLLLTGLYENIEALQNTPNLTFLYRATRINMMPLNQFTITDNYQKIFDLSPEDAAAMAKWTMGYSFAFQVLGYYTWQYDGDYQKAIPDAFNYLSEYSYIKIWSGLSAKDQQLAEAVSKSRTNKNKEIREILAWTSDQYNPYRMRLIRKGILNGDKYGYVYFTLPEFGRFISVYSDMLNVE